MDKSVMLDIDFIRKNPEIVKKAVQAKNEKVDIDELLLLDKQRRQLITHVDTLRNKRNQISEEIANLKQQNKDISSLLREAKTISEEIKNTEANLKEIEAKLYELLCWVPNIPVPDVPVGGAESNEVVRRWGELPKFDFTPLPHWEIGANLDIIDLPSAAKIAGGGFILLKGLGASLERAMINFMLDLHIKKHHYQEVIPPCLVNRTTMYTTGQLPKLETDMYHTTEDNFFLSPTAEVPLTNIFRDQIISVDDLPIYYVAATVCFRREAGSYGKQTRGIIRVHQFNKVELVKFVHPETSFDELEKLVKDAEEVLQMLGLAYRVVKLATGEMSFASAKTYDIEAWAPGLGRYLEVSSCGNFTDFQARRGNIRFRDRDGKVKFVHTLNGSGVALPRTLICLLETYQQKDGSVVIPEVLRPYLGGVKEIRKV